MATIMPRVVRRGNQFYFRVAVPLALVDRLGQRELKVSLRTCSPSEAKCRGRVLSNAIDVLFARLIRMTKLTQEQVRERVRAYFQDALNWCQEQALFIPTDKALDVEAEIASLGAYEQDLRKQLAALAYPPSVQAEAQSILSLDDPGKAVADHDLMLSACSGIMRAQVERARILAAMLSGHYEDTAPRDPMFAGMQPSALPPIPGEAPVPKEAPLSLKGLTERYCQFHAANWVKKTAADYERVLALACTVIGGSKLVKSLDIDDVKHLRDALACVPPNYMKSKANQGTSVLDIIASNDGSSALAVKTQDKYFSMFRSFLIWATNEGYIDKVPGASVKIAGAGKLGSGLID